MGWLATLDAMLWRQTKLWPDYLFRLCYPNGVAMKLKPLGRNACISTIYFFGFYKKHFIIIIFFLVSFFLWLPFGVSWVRSFSTRVTQEKPHFYQNRNFPDGILAKRGLLNPGNDI